MARNRRNIRRKRNIIVEFLTLKRFLIIISILTVVVGACIMIQKVQKSQMLATYAMQKEEIDGYTQQLYTFIDETISIGNDNISKTDEIYQLSAVGDLLCSQTMIDDAYNERTNSYDFSHMFAGVSQYTKNADIVMGTMETNFTNSEYTSKNTPIEFAKAAMASGLNTVSISHNHSLNYGLKGVLDTKTNLMELGYSVVGDTLGESTVLIKSVKGMQIAFLSYTYGFNDQDKKTDTEIESIRVYSEENVNKDVEYALENGAEYICVLIHWGDAMSSEISDSQYEMADYLVESGVDLIIGAHPSIVQPMEIRQNSEGKNVFIAYSIGTYISGMITEETKVELVLNIELRKSSEDGIVYLNKVDYTPIYVLDNGIDSENRYQLIDMKDIALKYANGQTDRIDEEIYQKLLNALERLNNLLVQGE